MCLRRDRAAREHRDEWVDAARLDDRLLVVRRAREVGEHRGRTLLRRVRAHAPAVAEETHERLDGVGGGDGLAVVVGARGKDSERLGGVHLGERVAQVEHRDKALDDGVARVDVVRGEVEERADGVLLCRSGVGAEDVDERRDGARLGERDLVFGVVARERLQPGGRVLLRDRRLRREKRDERRDAARLGDRALVVLGRGQVPERLGRVLV